MNKPQYFCCICGLKMQGYGNNPAPVATGGRCCDDCNASVVIPERLKQAANEKTTAEAARKEKTI